MWLIQVLNGLFNSLLLFLVSVGLSLILGLMGVLNLAHGVFYLLGAYVGYTMGSLTGSFLIAVISGAASSALLGFAIERLTIRHLLGEHLEQVLITFGFVYMFMSITKFFWGGYPKIMAKPALLEGSVELMGNFVPIYRLAIIVIGIIVAFCMWWVSEKTWFGIKLRAGVEDKQMASALGININAVFIKVFVLGSFLAGLAGVLGGPVIGAYIGLDDKMLMMALVIVIVGGFGTIQGALLGSLLIGFVEVFSKLWLQEASLFIVFIAMAVVLLLKPKGLLGKY
jgi:branched-chain amino acid transport system permease protein